MSDTQAPAKPKIQSEKVGSEPLETQPLQSEETESERLKNTSDAEQSESEQPSAAPPKTKLEKLLEEKQKLEKRIKQQQALESKEKRQRETREKILIGAAIQKQISKGALTTDWLRHILDAALTLERDRKLFHLPPLPETTAQTKGAGSGGLT